MAVWKQLAYALDVVPKSAFTAAGDILYATDVATYDALHAATNGYVLTLDTGLPVWATPAAAAAHATSHKGAGDDHLHLDELGVAGAAVDFNGKQATNMVLPNSAAPPELITEVLGMIYFDTDLSAYICTELDP